MNGEAGMDAALIGSQILLEELEINKILMQWTCAPYYKRAVAFDALSGEREYQDSLHKDTNQEQLSIPGELALLKVYLDKVFVAYADTFGDLGEKPTMDVIRKIGAIALRCMENHGSVKRKKLHPSSPKHFENKK